jgi:CMP/dCMP kinase
MLRSVAEGQEERQMIVAIDGQAGSGKSTLGVRLARDLHMEYIDTGALYRAAGLHFLQQGWPGGLAVDGLVQGMDLVGKPGTAGFQVFLDGVDVTERVRERQVGQMASQVASLAAVRQRLTKMIRDFEALGDLVVDGRDIGTVVFPDAEVKVFMTASAQARARRRQDDRAGGAARDLSETLREIEQRDSNDSNRPLAPMAVAPDAVLLDTTEMSLDQAYAALRSLVPARPRPEA